MPTELEKSNNDRVYFVGFLAILALAFSLTGLSESDLGTQNYGAQSLSTSGGQTFLTTTQDLAINITNMTSRYCVGILCNDGFFQMQKEGIYTLEGLLSFSAAGATDYSLRLFQNDVPVEGCSAIIGIATAGLRTILPLQCISAINQSDILNMRLTGLSLLPAISTVYEASFTAWRIQ